MELKGCAWIAQTHQRDRETCLTIQAVYAEHNVLAR